MTVSFCVIAYNEENAIKNLFHDICNQDYPHDKMEVILVDAMSEDHTKRLMEEFAEKEHDFLRVLVLENPKRLQAAGWNVAINAAQGDIILRIDAHTTIPSKFVSQNVECIKGGEAVSGGMRPNVACKKTPWQDTLLLAESSLFGSGIASYRRSRKKSYVKSVFHGAYRREVFEKVGLFNEYLGRTEDNEMHYRIRKAGYKIRYTPEIISYQHIRATLHGSIIQKYYNGYWIGLTTGICPGCLSSYHFVPMIFVLSLILAGILGGGLGVILPLVCVVTVYCIVNLLMSIVASIEKQKHWKFLFLPAIFLSMHLAYGFGTIVGLIRMPFWRVGKK